MIKKLLKHKNRIALTGLLLFPVIASASKDTSNPIMKVLNPISDLLTGPLPSVIALGLFAGAGLYIAFSGDIKSGGKLFAQVAVGIGIALGAVQILSWLGISGAIV